MKKQEELSGINRKFSDFEGTFPEKLFINPNLHQIHTNTTSWKSKGAFCLFSIFLYRFFAGANLPERSGAKPQNFRKFILIFLYR